MSSFPAKIGFGAMVFLFGLRIFFWPRWYAIIDQTLMDFTAHHRFWGSVWMLVGVIFLSLVIRQRMKDKKKEGSKGSQSTTESGPDTDKDKMDAIEDKDKRNAVD